MHSIQILILQVAVILVVARIVGLAFRRIRQPQVVGEMVAGILLGPSVLGWLSPEIAAALFPAESLGHLTALSQVGLLLFMFLVGLELEPEMLRGRRRAAVVTSQVSIVVPFLLGAVLAYYLYPVLAEESVSFTGFALFMGASMSITAFPVLARILTERNLLRTKLGALTIACAAVDDVSAWCILALVVAIVRAGSAGLPLWVTLLGSVLYVAVMLTLVRGALRRLAAYYDSRGRLTQDITAVILLLVLASAFTTEWLGIHALFGAFVLGAVMPKGRTFVAELNEKLEHVTVVLLLPLFFALTGLHTSIGLLQGLDMWMYCAIILFAAVLGKFGGSAVSARLTGLNWREAGALGILMNTRGLMELVILSIGLELGVISPALFAMMVIMALVTTFMTTPLLYWIYPPQRFAESVIETGGLPEEREFTVLIPVSLPSSGPELLRVATAIAPRGRARFYALHLSRPEAGAVSVEPPSSEPLQLQPLLDAATRMGTTVRPLTFVSRSPGHDISEVAHAKAADLVLMGWHKPVLDQSILGGTVADVMRRCSTDVAVYLARRFGAWRRILVPYTGTVHDRAALELARRLRIHLDVEVTILHVVEPEAADRKSRRRLADEQASLSADGVDLKVVESTDAQAVAVQEARRGYDLVIIGASEEWGMHPKLFGRSHEELARTCPASLLVVRKGKPAVHTPSERLDPEFAAQA